MLVLAASLMMAASPLEDAADIQRAIEGFVAAYNAGNLDAVVAYYDEHLVKIRQGAAPESRADVARRLAEVFKAFSGRLEVQNDEVLVAGDLAITRGTLRVFLTPRAGGDVQRIERRYLEVWRRHNGRWVVFRSLDNSAS